MESLQRMQSSLDLAEVVKRALKYLIEGVAVAVAAYYIPLLSRNQTLKLEEIAVIGITAASTFAVLDIFAPSISASVRQGAGFGVGANLVGFPKMA